MTADILLQWAIEHGVSYAAVHDLRRRLGEIPDELAPTPAGPGDTNEARVQADLRLAAPTHGMMIYRNNVGAIKDERGVPVRYGLANDTAALNKVMKSADLIGWKREVITMAHVGHPFARFVSIECKRPGWSFVGTEHEVAQRRWRDLVNSQGGLAIFSTGELPQ